MNIIAVDDEFFALQLLREAIEDAAPGHPVSAFDSAAAALEYAAGNAVDVAFLDVRMPGMSGLELAKRLQDLRADTNVIFVSGYADHALDAFSVTASGYVLKPVTPEDVRRGLDTLRYPPPARPGVWVQTFGNFEVFVHGKPVVFRLARSKEILAYLVDRRGAGVKKKELAAVLWNQDEYGRNRQIYLQELIAEMLRALAEAGIGDIVLRWRGHLAVDVPKVACDYYGFIEGDPRSLNAYQGEYMTNYSWAEFTVGALDSRKDR